MGNPTRICSIDGCDKKIKARGWCGMHWQRWNKTGDANATTPARETGLSVSETLRRNSLYLTSGCRVWQGFLNPDGYGTISIANRNYLAHRVSYEVAKGKIVGDLVIDHLCRNRACVNPAHMEPVENGENVLRGYGPAALNARKIHCPKGHEYTPENTYIQKKGWRICRTCQRDRRRTK